MAEHDDLAQLIACPHCDALYHVRLPEEGERAVCGRCHSVLIRPRKRAGMRIIMIAAAVAVLVVGAVWFPFLRISRAGFSNDATLLGTALSFGTGPLALLSVAVTLMIVLLPLTRALLLIYVLGPIVFDRAPRVLARPAFRLSEALRPWSMGEIFALGCAVALVKVADLAQLSFGPAFWMFSALVVLTVVQDRTLDRWSVWQALEPQPLPPQDHAAAIADPASRAGTPA
ncbi:paraquat-inducible protein A [Pseudoroseicyclus aestuarii]|uniref:Paraquat-inducible protein A n=1 Tax=Pseudoroseicyclus aestuarii TaxID=1795041 RepID=A0A318SX61_9RHOB|nr:paraquat-inducible protein A [Pseudoroseicyclus aestuarii]PYE86002.1 paraquat-inducible protein A [Pseudoroseicyclus aestuarii]